jgi:putative tryptophan/tyrosine transport system substrate-binding protein
VITLNASNDSEFEAILGSLDRQQIEAVMIASDNVFANDSAKLGRVSARHNIPAISAYRDFVRAGELMSYGSSDADAYHQVGIYVGRILKGEQPADLPVIQATKADLVLNLKTAQALGLTLPLPLLGRADEVIE